MFRSCLAAAIALIATGSASASITQLDLADYRLVATHDLPSVQASEASAVTWNWDTDTLFVLGDEGDYVVEVNKQGQRISSMNLFGFDDTEGLSYLGNGQFVLVEERLQDVHRFSYTAGGSIGRSATPAVSVGATVGNVGLEGLSYDPLSGRFILVKEKTPQAVYDAALDFTTGSATVTELVPPANQFARLFDTLDLADVQTLTTVASLRGTADQDNLLIYSQETPRLMEVTRSGEVLSQFDFSAIAEDAEGVTIDGNGVIYIVGETPRLYVLAPVPEPEGWALLLAGLGLIGATARRRLS
ncbi:SdiA-regulated domain-containing protein [Methyloversatilis sp.]|uniref:SdiA-regulated domain-containing protein n=1 Tax=Methyloversatilis sp. TaxID=2569862 RepID=UPI0027B942A7|nr:SdiA-regulated domain-containing protein [Methyloversatilis sp.]